nr:leucine-rich repeat-containing protein 37A3-like [Cavia porcellus]
MMFILRFGAPRFMFWPQLWLLVLVAPHPEWAQFPAQMDPELFEHNSLFFPYKPLPSAQPLHTFTTRAEPGEMDYPGTSAPERILLTPEESTGESLPDPDKFAVPHQGLHDKLVGPQRLPEVDSMVDGHENEHLALPSQVRRKEEISASEQAADHQSHVLRLLLGSKSSTPSKFVSLLKLKDIAQHWQLPKEAFGAAHQSEYPQLQKQTVDLSMGKAEHDSLHLGDLQKPTEPPQPCEHKETSHYQLETQTKHLEAPQIQSSLPEGEGPYQDSQPAEETVPSFIHQEALGQQKFFTKAGLGKLSENEKVSVPSLRSSATHLPPLPNSILRSGEIPKEQSPVLQSASAKTQGPTVNELPVPMPGQYPTQHPTLTPVTIPPLDMLLSTSDEHTTEPAHSVALQKVTFYPRKNLDVSFSHQGEVRAQQQILPPIIIEALNLEHSTTPLHTSEVQLHPYLQTSIQLPEPSMEAEAQYTLQRGMKTPTSLRELATSPSVTEQPMDTGPIQNPKATTEAEPSVALKEVTPSPLQHPVVTLAQLEEGEVRQPILTPGISQALKGEQTRTSPSASAVPLSPAFPETTSYPEPLMEALGQRRESSHRTNQKPPAQGPAQPPPLTSGMIQPLDVGNIVHPDLTVEAGHSVDLQKAASSPQKHPEVTLAHPDQVHTQYPILTPSTLQFLDMEHSITPPPATGTQIPSVMQQSSSKPLEPSMKAGDKYTMAPEMTTLTSQVDKVKAPTFPSGVVPQIYMGPTMRPKAITEAEHSVALQEVTVSPLRLPDVEIKHSKQVQAPGPTLLPIVFQPENLEQTVLPLPTTGTQLTQNFWGIPSQPPEPSLKAVDQNMVSPAKTNQISLGQSPAQPPPLTSGIIQPPDMVHITHPDLTVEGGHSVDLKKAASSPQKHPEVTLAHPDQVHTQYPILTPSTLQFLDMEHSITPPPATGTQIPSVMQQSSSKPLEPSMKAGDKYTMAPEMTTLTSQVDKVKAPTFPSGVVPQIYMGPTMRPKAITEAEHSVALQEVTVSPLRLPDVEIKHSKQVQAPGPTLLPIVFQPENLEQAVLPLPTTGTQLTQNFWGIPSQPPEPSLKAIDQNMVSPAKANQISLGRSPAQPPPLTSGMIQPLDMVHITHPDLTVEAGHSVDLQKAASSPQKHPEVNLAHQGQVHSHHQNMAPEMDTGRSMTPLPAMRTKASSVIQENPSQPPEASMDVVVKIAIPREMPNPTSQGQDLAQPPTSPIGTIQPLGVVLTKSAAPTTEAEHSVALHKASTPALKQHGLTSSHPHLTPITDQPLDVEQNTNHYSAQMVQDATSTSNICELCTCDNDTLSCTGLNPKQRLRQVPVVEVNSFTVL